MALQAGNIRVLDPVDLRSIAASVDLPGGTRTRAGQLNFAERCHRLGERLYW